jgi:hypothetical protein
MTAASLTSGVGEALTDGVGLLVGRDVGRVRAEVPQAAITPAMAMSGQAVSSRRLDRRDCRVPSPSTEDSSLSAGCMANGTRRLRCAAVSHMPSCTRKRLAQMTRKWTRGVPRMSLLGANAPFTEDLAGSVVTAAALLPAAGPRVGELPRVDPDPNPARGNHAAMIHARVVRWGRPYNLDRLALPGAGHLVATIACRSGGLT